MTETFTLPSTVEAPSYTSKMKTIARKLVANFGDGYSQRVKDGINTQQESWDLVFINLQDDDAETIMEFFEAMGEVESFYWLNPRGNTLLYTATNAEREYSSYSSSTISVTFLQDLNG